MRKSLFQTALFLKDVLIKNVPALYDGELCNITFKNNCYGIKEPDTRAKSIQ